LYHEFRFNMVDFQDRDSVKELVENGISTLQTLLSYLLLPVALPMIFLQECIAWFREKVGLNNRSLEGKVRVLCSSLNRYFCIMRLLSKIFLSVQLVYGRIVHVHNACVYFQCFKR